MEPDSCGSVRNTSGAPSSNELAGDCKSAAAKSRDCCCRPVTHAASAAVHTNAHYSKSRDCCCRTANHAASAVAHRNARHSKSRDCCCRPVCHAVSAAAHTNARYSRSLGGCCCSLALKAARAGRWRRQIASLREPTAGDCPGFRGLIATVNFPPGVRFRNLPEGDRDHSHFPALPRRGGCCPLAAAHCCPSRAMMSGSSSSSKKAAGFARAHAAGGLCRS